MPNATKIDGTPLEEAIKGFDRVEDLLFVRDRYSQYVLFFGYDYQVATWLEDTGTDPEDPKTTVLIFTYETFQSVARIIGQLQ